MPVVMYVAGRRTRLTWVVMVSLILIQKLVLMRHHRMESASFSDLQTLVSTFKWVLKPASAISPEAIDVTADMEVQLGIKMQQGLVIETIRKVEGDIAKLVPKLEKQATDAEELEGTATFEQQREKFKAAVEKLTYIGADLGFSMKTKKNRKNSKPLTGKDAKEMVQAASQAIKQSMELSKMLRILG
eukprot:1585534-Amphidinium_carterae.1